MVGSLLSLVSRRYRRPVLAGRFPRTAAVPVGHWEDMERATMPELDPAERVESFAEVDQVISKQTAYDEASRCLRCYRLYSVVTEMDLPRELPVTHNEPSLVE